MCRARWCHTHLTFCLFQLPSVTWNFSSNAFGHFTVVSQCQVRQIHSTLVLSSQCVLYLSIRLLHMKMQGNRKKDAVTPESPNNMDAFSYSSQRFFSFSQTSTHLHHHAPRSTSLGWIESNAPNQPDAMQRLIRVSPRQNRFFPPSPPCYPRIWFSHPSH